MSTARDPALMAELSRRLATALGGKRFSDEDAKRVAGLHPQHEVDAPLQVQAEVQPFRHEPRRRWKIEPLRQQRIDAYPGKNDEDNDDRDDLPTKVLDHD